MKEIERKFLVKGNAWKDAYKNHQAFPPVLIKQYYFKHKDPNIRLRIEEFEDEIGKCEKATLAFKYPTANPRIKEEYEFKVKDIGGAKKLASKCNFGIIKTRYCHFQKDGERVHIFEIDEYGGNNVGLVTVDVELEDEDQEIALPEWVGEEITEIAKYSNFNLSHEMGEKDEK